MASPVDAALIAAQIYKPRPAANTNARTRAVAQDEAIAAVAKQGRRQAAAVTLSLSAEALDILNGNKERPVRIERDPSAGGTPVVEAAEAEIPFEPGAETGPHRREAPIAQLGENVQARPLAPGSRLDILV